MCTKRPPCILAWPRGQRKRKRLKTEDIPVRSLKKRPISSLPIELAAKFGAGCTMPGSFANQESTYESELRRVYVQWLRDRLSKIVNDQITLEALLAVATGQLRHAEIASHVGVERSAILNRWKRWKKFISDNWMD